MSSTLNHSLVEDMDVGKSSLSIPSFTHSPTGDEKFSMTLAVPFGLGLHMIPLTLAVSGRSSGSKGPAAKPCVTHSAMASVTSAANSNALGALVLTVGCRAMPLHPMSAP